MYILIATGRFLQKSSISNANSNYIVRKSGVSSGLRLSTTLKLLESAGCQWLNGSDVYLSVAHCTLSAVILKVIYEMEIKLCAGWVH